ncbi:galactosylgalactosylxylosylprotein 3-beta-glucuronosyltransferase I [Palaemon carinicauda]|uniref:galactosylgalactosylxylosylprotein 3-beta-glucuronosyltransferase I n=1 Tax=Palaemon carinicauda TaxID=392227 RepID=UPI0035B5E65F
MALLNIYSLQRKMKRKVPYILIVLFLIFGYYGGFFSELISSAERDPFAELSSSTLKKILNLQRENQKLRSALRKYNIAEDEYLDRTVTVIYVITPTYTRPQQKAELTRLKNIFLHIPSLHWIVVEDAKEKSNLVSQFLKVSGLPYTHLNQPTPEVWKLQETDPNWHKPRGVLQRNLGMKWLRRKLSAGNIRKGVLYFADDDNTYSIELFEEMRDTKKVSVWPVGLVGGVMVERPQVLLVDHESRYEVSGWLTGWRPDRPFATDMAGFAVNLNLLMESPDAEFSFKSKRGFLESDFLEKITTRSELEPKADLCTKVYVWHTQTLKPNLKDEERLRKAGKSTDAGIEV